MTLQGCSAELITIGWQCCVRPSTQGHMSCQASTAPKQQQGGDLKQADRPHTASSKAHLRRWQR